MFATAIRYVAKKSKPKMKPIKLMTSPEQTLTITRVVFDILKEHGPLTIADTWEHVKEVGFEGIEQQEANEDSVEMDEGKAKSKQFLYTTWFTKPNIKQRRPPGTFTSTSISKSS